jgi:membrane-associated protease RseP (regulator of RpoE activity)
MSESDPPHGFPESARRMPVTDAAVGLDEDPRLSSDSPAGLRWRLNLALFVATVVSVLFTGALHTAEEPPDGALGVLQSGWIFALPLMAILVVHEFGHYIAARIHRVDASLPFFIPLPMLSPFGTMGAIIAMRGRIRSRNALLDIGAAGPLAGLVVAIPVVIVGLSLSPVLPQTESGYIQEGQSLLYLGLKWLVLGPIPEGHDVFLHPTALAGWAGLLVTMINLLPWGQLDGGHVAYALFGARQDRYARLVRVLLLPLFAYNAIRFVLPVLRETSELPLGIAIGNSTFWLVWFFVLGLIGSMSGGSNHPPTEPGVLSPVRRIIAWVTLACFVLLFMPTPWAAF